MDAGIDFRQRPMLKLQILAISLCIVVNMLDGFDVLVMAFAAPAVSTAWALSPAALGGLFSAGLVGMALGSLFLSPLADRIGRRNTILLALVIMTVGMLLSAACQQYWQLMAMRVLTGLALGAALASLNTMVAEYASVKSKNIAIAALHAGYPVGATLGGLVSAQLIVSYDWPALFLFGGLMSLLMLPVIWKCLPESLDYLQNCQPSGALAQINQLRQKLAMPTLEQLPPVQQKQTKGSVLALLSAPLRRNTLLVWLSYFSLMISFYFVMSWTPKLLVDAGMSVQNGISGSVVINLGGIVGGLSLGWLSARFNLTRLIAAFMLFTAGSLWLFAGLSGAWQWLLLVAGFMGYLLMGSMIGLYALTPELYHTRIRTTGIGWSIGIGRLGAIVGPALAGLLLNNGWSPNATFSLFALPMLLAALAVVWVRRP